MKPARRPVGRAVPNRARLRALVDPSVKPPIALLVVLTLLVGAIGAWFPYAAGALSDRAAANPAPAPPPAGAKRGP